MLKKLKICINIIYDENIKENGIWEGLEVAKNHHYDSGLAISLTEFFKSENIKSVADFGCGMGTYVKTFKENNINATGFDGNPNTPQLTNNICSVLDLSLSIQFNEAFDWVMSLEVGEHLPPQFEDIYMNNLHNNKYGIVLSWALKGQGGDGHVNEQNNEYIKTKMCNLGYVNDIDCENKIRNASTIWWFKNTVMVFRKK